MHPEQKKLGELLVEAGLISPAQLAEALRYQRISGGRMGSNLVTLGFLSEDTLMDFLSHQTGVPRIDLRSVDIPPAVLERIPRRLAEQMNILPISFKEPKSLVLAMADPSDLNAIDSARFSSGLNVEPVVASHSALRHAIVEQYRKLDILSGRTVDIGMASLLDDGLPVALDLAPKPIDPRGMGATPPVLPPSPGRPVPRDPFFDGPPVAFGGPLNPTGFMEEDIPSFMLPQEPVPPQPPPPPKPAPPPAASLDFIPDRGSMAVRAKRLESYQTRTIVLGLVRLLQRRGVLAEDELTRLIQNLIDTREIREGSDREL